MSSSSCVCFFLGSCIRTRVDVRRYAAVHKMAAMSPAALCRAERTSHANYEISSTVWLQRLCLVICNTTHVDNLLVDFSFTFHLSPIVWLKFRNPDLRVRLDRWDRYCPFRSSIHWLLFGSYWCLVYPLPFLPLDEAIAVFVIVFGSDRRTSGRAGGNAFGAS